MIKKLYNEKSARVLARVRPMLSWMIAGNETISCVDIVRELDRALKEEFGDWRDAYGNN